MLGRKDRLSRRDNTTRQLQASGVYSMGHGPHPYIVDDNTVEAVKEKKIYGFWAGVWYTTVLSILLFWLPPFGQMIAGYVGGRKGGTPRKGMIAAFAPMSLIFLLFLLRYMGNFVVEIDWLLALPGLGAEWMGVNLPVFGPVIEFISGYAHTFVSLMWFGDFFIYPYVLTVIFGYVGGILSLQHQRELELQGKDHPFVPFTFVNPQPLAQVSDSGQTPIIMGKIPDGWNMKKDRKKGKW